MTKYQKEILIEISLKNISKTERITIMNIDNLLSDIKR